MNEMRENKSYDLVITSVFVSIIVIQAIVPMLGYIPVFAINATIIQVTVAIGAIILGAKKGAFLGLVFGLTSIWKNTFTPNPSSFIFSPFVEVGGYHGDYRSLIISLIPRILIGLSAATVYIYFDKKNKRKTGLILSGAVSSMTNTILVMLGIFLLYGHEYAGVREQTILALPGIIMGIIGTQGVLEAIVSAVLCLGVGNVLLKALER
jgi:hypothetical protein